MNNYTSKETNKHGDIRYRNDKDQYHKTDGPAVELANGDKSWWVNGKLHRTDGPAIEWADGSKEWWVNGKAHRLDGPAVEYANGGKYWYVNGEGFTEEEFKKHPLVFEYNLDKIINEILVEN